MSSYSEPKVSFLILDYQKPEESRLLLESIHRNAKFPFKVIYLHNGECDWGQRFLKQDLIDQLIITKKNNGLGIGTRDLFAACFSEYAIYVQNDQVLGREFTEQELDALISMLGKTINGLSINSISLAGAPCGLNVYSERAHLIPTKYYKFLEDSIIHDIDGSFALKVFDGLPNGGAGPYHDEPWREGWMQEFYRLHDMIHWTYPNVMFIDNGQTAVRQNPDGTRWKHYPDNKQLWLEEGTPMQKFIYPKFTDAEWDEVLRTGKWPAGRVPEKELEHSFAHWHPKITKENNPK